MKSIVGLVEEACVGAPEPLTHTDEKKKFKRDECETPAQPQPASTKLRKTLQSSRG